MTALGIDLGTSNSAVSVYRRGKAESLQVDGQSTTPSCVAANPRGGLLVGTVAKRRALIDPEHTVVAIKREMGSRDYRVSLDGQQYSPVDISSLILEKLVAGASEQLGEQVKNVVISVPAYFNSNQKEDTRLAGEKAGLNVLQLIPEPTAAAIAYGLDKGRDQTILVYDLGGGTFDVSILRVDGNRFDVLGIGGAHDLGGEDFDRRLIDLIIAELRKDPTLADEYADLDASRVERQLKESAEIAKKELSVAETVEIEIPELAGGSSFHLKLTRQQYETVIQELVDRTVTITMDTLKQVKLGPDDVDRVVLVGGSTRIPLIQKTIARQICDPFIADNVDEVVAQGAAIMAASLSSVAEDFAPIEVTNITAHSLGIRAAEDQFARIIPRGTQLPAEANKIFTTARDNADRTDVVVFQGEQDLCSDNQQIGGFGLVGIERAPAGTPRIEVHFVVDRDDILTVTARDLSTGLGGEVTIEKFEPKPYEAERQPEAASLESLRIGVSPTGCDDAGAILGKLGLRFRTLKNTDFKKPRVLKQFDVLFINCLCDTSQISCLGMMCNPKKNAAPLRQFVSEGGVLYVSDYAYGNISIIFPDKITFGGKTGKMGRHEVQIVDPEIQRLAGSSVTVEFGPRYVVAQDVDDSCRVYMKRESEPVLVSFPYGDGHVVYTSFHNAAKIDDNIARTIGYVILQTVSLATSTPLVELVNACIEVET